MDPITTRRLVHDRTAVLQHTAAIARLERELRDAASTATEAVMAVTPADRVVAATDAVPTRTPSVCLPGDARCAAAERAA